MASGYYSNNRSALFSIEDDIDDETFLKNSRVRNTNLTEYEDTQQQMLQRKMELEERMLKSSEKSISLLRESENIGNATAEELLQQREQLERTERRLEEINDTLRYSQRHIQGIKSVFGSLRNYLTRKSAEPPASSTSKEGETNKSVPSSSKVSAPDSGSWRSGSSFESSVNDHPGMRIRNLDDANYFDSRKEKFSSAPKPSINEILDRNLDEMGDSIIRLRGLATGLGEEIDSQNELIEKITVSSDKANIKITQQNKEMNKILKK